MATSGDQVVAVGSRELTPMVKGRSGESLLFTSDDRGVTWASVKVPEPSDSSNFSSSLDEVTDTDSGFVVGGSYYDHDEGTYRPLLLGNSDLAHWQHLRQLPERDESSEVDELLSIGSTVVVAQGSTTADSRSKPRCTT